MIGLERLSACFEGVIPSIIATASADGMPNISYLSHVALVDEGRVALSNQFFTKTAANILANPSVGILLVDPRDGAQHQLTATFEQSLDRGDLFDKMASHLRATSAQLGMADVMALRGVDIYKVASIAAVWSPVGAVASPPPTAEMRLAAATAVTGKISQATEISSIIDAILDGLRDSFGFGATMLLMLEPAGERLVTVGSRGYPWTGIGSEVAMGEALIGTAAVERHSVRINDMSRIRRFGSAIRASSADENRTRTIFLPSLPDAMSQIALPLIAQGAVRGVLFLETSERLAFLQGVEAALSIVAAHAAAALALAEHEASNAPAIMTSIEGAGALAGRPFKVVRHTYDDSIFINGDYLIKGVAGRLLVHLLGLHLREGRATFTNREMRLSDELRLPEFKDNLETRLLLLRRRLDEKAAPIRLRQTGRGRLSLELAGPAHLETVAARG
ncbi:GAF domain-containing protein [Methylocapsa sp. S129]|uniref:pyridoxamine 5'-phosphate oxidase family protein n=1 Tax=Methylocapsa sp. S129 TaxID=1641869 RepID=UPI00131BCB2B|nr:GAF domain-containing protein [Methylocapsa sp. S129]